MPAQPVLWLACGVAEVPDDDGWLTPPEAARLNRMRYVKRRSEARLGRWTAKRTLARALGLPGDPAGLNRIVIRNAPDGAPYAIVDDAPAPFTIAMTDRADWAACALIGSDDRIGCDLELVEPRSDRFVEDYFTPAEQRTVRSGDIPLLANLVWSAKESALKVLRTGLRRDTRSVEVRLDEAVGNGPWHPLNVATDDGRTFPGWWLRYGEFLLTVAGAVETPPPTSLQEPSPLATATPSHTWMHSPLRR
jgi:4'-phosphopantetheinyl transferase